MACHVGADALRPPTLVDPYYVAVVRVTLRRQQRMYLRLGQLAEARYHYCQANPFDFAAVGKLVRVNAKIMASPIHNTHYAHIYVATRDGATTLEHILYHG